MAVRSSFILVRWEMGRERRILKIAYMIRYLFGPLRFFFPSNSTQRKNFFQASKFGKIIIIHIIK
jgi:hypothetical protein